MKELIYILHIQMKFMTYLLEKVKGYMINIIKKVNVIQKMIDYIYMIINVLQFNKKIIFMEDINVEMMVIGIKQNVILIIVI